MKKFHHILGAMKFEVHLQNFYEVLTRSGWGVTIYLGLLGNHLTYFTACSDFSGSILLTANLVSLKRENSEPILTVKIVEWRKFIDYSGLSIEADPSRVGKMNICFVRIGSIPSTSSGNPHIVAGQRVEFGTTKDTSVQTNKNLAAEIVPHISSALIDLGVIFDKYFLSGCTKLADSDPVGNLDS